MEGYIYRGVWTSSGAFVYENIASLNSLRYDLSQLKGKKKIRGTFYKNKKSTSTTTITARYIKRKTDTTTPLLPLSLQSTTRESKTLTILSTTVTLLLTVDQPFSAPSPLTYHYDTDLNINTI